MLRGLEILTVIQALASTLLSGIHLVRVAAQVQMVAFVNTLDEWLVEHPKVREPRAAQLPALTQSRWL